MFLPEYILPDCYFKDKLCFFPALHPLGGFWSKSRNREDARFRQNLTGFFEFPPKGRRALFPCKSEHQTNRYTPGNDPFLFSALSIVTRKTSNSCSNACTRHRIYWVVTFAQGIFFARRTRSSSILHSAQPAPSSRKTKKSGVCLVVTFRVSSWLRYFNLSWP